MLNVKTIFQAEKAKQLLYQAKYGRFGLGDPFSALQRDSDNLKDNSFDETAIKSMYDNQLAQLENLIATQRKAQLKMREQLSAAEKRYHKVKVMFVIDRESVLCYCLPWKTLYRVEIIYHSDWKKYIM